MTSTVFTPGSRVFSMNGPVPFAFIVAAFSLPLRTSTGVVALFFSHHDLLIMYHELIVSGRMGNGSVVTMSMVKSSTLRISLIGPT